MENVIQPFQRKGHFSMANESGPHWLPAKSSQNLLPTQASLRLEYRRMVYGESPPEAAYGESVLAAVSALREWLLSADPKVGARLPSERVLATQLGLKHYAVNRAMSRLIADGVITREGYKLYFAAQVNRPVELSCDLVISRGSVFERSYCKVAKELGIRVTVRRWKSNVEAVAFLRQLEGGKTECVLFDAPASCSSSAWEPAMNRLASHGIPTVSVRQFIPDIPCVLADYPRALDLAFAHLIEMGHQELALWTDSPRAPTSIEILNAWKLLCRQYGCHASENRILCPTSFFAMREDTLELSRKLSGDWSDVSAIVVFAGMEPKIQSLLDELRHRQRHVPEDLSMVSLGDSNQLKSCNPPISAVAFDDPLIEEAAFILAQRMMRRKRDPGPPPLAGNIRVEPTFVFRASTAPPSVLPRHKRPRKTGRFLPLQVDAGERPETLAFALQRPYAMTALLRESRFHTVMLTKYVNRPLRFRRGWLGDLPLKHFSTGKHVIHGVPFEILGGTKRTDCGGVVFHSFANSTGNGKQLPASLRIPVGITGSAVYILHGCGYAKFLHAFGTYRFYSKRKKLGEIALVTLGQPPPDFTAEDLSKATTKANIQDWWPDFPHVDFPHARRAPINESEEADTVPRFVYLYTMEWINPYPDAAITHIDVSVDPDQSTTLGILAISVLRK